MRLWALIAVLTFSSLRASADYLPLELSELFGGSHLVVRGTIVAVDDTTFDVRVERGFHGKPPIPLTVRRYRDWPDGRRWTGYAEGQHLILFLEPSDKEPDVWHIRGLGGEGEMPVWDGQVFTHGINLSGFERQVHQIGGGEVFAYRFKLNAFEAALSGFLRCFAETPTPDTPCTENEIDQYRQASPLAAFLATGKENESK